MKNFLLFSTAVAITTLVSHVLGHNPHHCHKKENEFQHGRRFSEDRCFASSMRFHANIPWQNPFVYPFNNHTMPHQPHYYPPANPYFVPTNQPLPAGYVPQNQPFAYTPYPQYAPNVLPANVPQKPSMQPTPAMNFPRGPPQTSYPIPEIYKKSLASFEVKKTIENYRQFANDPLIDQKLLDLNYIKSGN